MTLDNITVTSQDCLKVFLLLFVTPTFGSEEMAQTLSPVILVHSLWRCRLSQNSQRLPSTAFPVASGSQRVWNDLQAKLLERFPQFSRPPSELILILKLHSCSNWSIILSHLDYRDSFLSGPLPLTSLNALSAPSRQPRLAFRKGNAIKPHPC